MATRRSFASGLIKSFITLTAILVLLFTYSVLHRKHASNRVPLHEEMERHGNTIFSKASEEGDPDDEEEECPDSESVGDPSRLQTRSAALIIVTILIVLSILFEFSREAIEEHTDELVQPIIEHTWEELTVLGFLSLLSFLVVKVGLMRKISCAIGFEEDKLDDMTENVHMLLFFVMVIFIIFVYLMVLLGKTLGKNWKKYEDMCRRPKHYAQEYIHAKESLKRRGFFHSLIPVMFDPQQELPQLMRFMGMRSAFINPRDPTHRILPHDFDFSLYLSLLLGELLGEIVEITPIIWVGLETFLLMLWGLTFLDNGVFDIIWIVVGWVLMIISFIVFKSLKNIRHLVTPSVKNVTFAGPEGSVNAGPDQGPDESHWLLEKMTQHEIYDRETRTKAVVLHAHRPPYLDFSLQQRSELGTRFLGKPPNKHEMCFPFDRHGIHFYVNILRMSLLLLSVYLAVSLIHFSQSYIKEFGTGLGVLSIVLTFFPVFLTVFIFIPQSIVLLVTVSNIEKMRKKEVIARVLREMHTRKALNLLSILQMLQFYTRKSKVGVVKDGITEDKRDPNLSENLSPEKKQDLREVFEMFDADGSGFVESKELKDILSLLGEEISEIEADGLIASIDEDGDGRMNFNEFCAFMSLHQQEAPGQNIDEMVDALFSVFDKDGSGQVSAVEFREIMKELCRDKLSEEDLDMVIEDIDKDDDGEIDLKEFEDMLKYYLKQE